MLSLIRRDGIDPGAREGTASHRPARLVPIPKVQDLVAGKRSCKQSMANSGL